MILIVFEQWALILIPHWSMHTGAGSECGLLLRTIWHYKKSATTGLISAVQYGRDHGRAGSVELREGPGYGRLTQAMLSSSITSPAASQPRVLSLF